MGSSYGKDYDSDVLASESDREDDDSRSYDSSDAESPDSSRVGRRASFLNLLRDALSHPRTLVKERVRGRRRRKRGISRPRYLHDRILAFAYEQPERAWGKTTQDNGYVRCLEDAAEALRGEHGANAILINIGGLLLHPQLYRLFGNNVCEFAVPWEHPVGVGVCSLDNLFAICSSIQNWLALDEENVAVLHTRGRCIGDAMGFLVYVASSYLTFSGEFDHFSEALHDMQEAFESMNSLSGWAAWGAAGAGREQLSAPSYRLTAGQKRYAHYFLGILRGPAVPKYTWVKLRQIVLSSAPAVEGVDGCRPFVKIYQRGGLTFSSLVDGKVPSWQMAAHEWMIPYPVDLSISGDIVIVLFHWTGDELHDEGCPLFSFAFHTAFVDTGLVRVSRKQVDVGTHTRVSLPEGFFMDLTIEPVADGTLAPPPDASSWKDLLMMCGRDFSSSALASKAKAGKPALPGQVAHTQTMDDVIMEMQVMQATGDGDKKAAAGGGGAGGGGDAPKAPKRRDSLGRFLKGVMMKVTEGGAVAEETSEPAAVPDEGKEGAKPAGVRPPPPPPGPPRPAGAGPPPPPPPPGGLLAAKKRAVGGGLRGLHWTKLRTVKGTLWEEMDSMQCKYELSEAEKAVLRRLFEIAPAGKGTKRDAAEDAGGVEGSSRKPKNVLQLISLTRANNLQVMLAHIKLTDNEAKRIIASGDAKRELSLEKLCTLLQVIPTEEEEESIRRYLAQNDASSLTPPEQFLASMAQLPRLRSKIQVLIFLRQFDVQVKEATDILQCVEKASDKVCKSMIFKALMAIVLAVGNALNEGTARGDAKGVRVDALLKLGDVKVTNAGAKAIPTDAAPGKEKDKSGPEDKDKDTDATYKDGATTAATDPSSTSLSPESCSALLLRSATLLECIAALAVDNGIVDDYRLLTGELAAVGQAARHSKADLMELLRSLDAGMQAVLKEVALLRVEPRRPAGNPGESAAASAGNAAAMEDGGALGNVAAEGANGQAAPDAPVTGEEGGFKLQVEEFLRHAESVRQQLDSIVARVTTKFTALAEYFGENPEAMAPEAVFGLLWQFATEFERARQALAQKSTNP
eukprot:jgi/Mesvir1/16637/Mv10170-RA.1